MTYPDLNDANDHLLSVYEASWDGLMAARALDPGASGPHLPLIPERWGKLPVRLAVVGQETRGWDRRDTAAAQADLYPSDGLVHGKSYTPFWKAVAALSEALNGQPDAPVLWCNLVPVEVGGKDKRSALAERVRDAARAAVSPAPDGAGMGLLAHILRAARPDAAVFFTGPHAFYAWEMEQQFPGLMLEAVPGHSESALAAVRHPALPSSSFRSYHPNYLQRQGRLQERMRELADRVQGEASQSLT